MCAGFRRAEGGMAARPIWRGHLRLALVTCPIALHTVHRASGELHFHFINPKTGNRVRTVTLDAGTDEELSRSSLARGYEFEKDRYVVLEPEDFESARIESSSVMTIDKFIAGSDIPPIYYDTSYYLAPDGEAGQDVYAVLREAIERTGKVALTRIVIAQRERTIALRRMDGRLVAHTLNEQRDLNPAQPLFETVQHIKLDPEMIALATQLVERQSETYDPQDLEDRYETRVRAMLDAKISGEAVREDAVPALAESNVIDLMAALRKSLGEVSSAPAGKATTATARRPKRADAEVRQQSALKLPIKGGKTEAVAEAVAPISEVRTAKGRRKAS